MANLFYLHWHQAEAEQRAELLAAAGHNVHVHSSTREPPRLKDKLPDFAIISLDRLPSHGRAVAEWLWEGKSRRHIPIIFEGGEPDKVAVTQRKFPGARFCGSGKVLSVIGRLGGKRSSRAQA